MKQNLEKNIRDYLFSLPKPHFSPAVKLAESDISGIGLKAQRNIEKDEILVVELGPVVSGKFIEVIELLTGYECNLCVGWDSYILHSPLHNDYQGGYINHSCDPNVGLLANGVWCAIRNISKEEEIVCDYGTFETCPGWTMECECDSSNCRKLITAKDYQRKDLRKRLGKWFAPYLRVKD